MYFYGNFLSKHSCKIDVQQFGSSFIKLMFWMEIFILWTLNSVYITIDLQRWESKYLVWLQNSSDKMCSSDCELKKILIVLLSTTATALALVTDMMVFEQIFLILRFKICKFQFIQLLLGQLGEWRKYPNWVPLHNYGGWIYIAPLPPFANCKGKQKWWKWIETHFAYARFIKLIASIYNIPSKIGWY